MFKKGKEYLRAELLSFVGSKQLVSGMIWGNKEPDSVILTSGGKHGEEAGYSDRENSDGTWFYIGQGSKGDQNPYSKANLNLTNGAKTVLLFSTREPSGKEAKERGSRRKFYMFKGIFEVGSWDIVIPTAGNRNGNKLVQYHLLPANNIYNSENDIVISKVVSEPNNLYTLRTKIENQSTKPIKSKSTNVIEYQLRSKQVKEYALIRANGDCEFCLSSAPFEDLYGIPFLEVHHIHRLADDGPDIPENVAAICPNCHREAHYGFNKKELKRRLTKIIKEKEARIDIEGAI